MLPLIAQTITFTSTPPTPGRPGIAYTVTATGGGSGNPVVFSLDGSSGASVCSATAGGAVTFLAPGTCAIAANQTGGGEYAGALVAVQNITVAAQIAQSVAITSVPPVPAWATDGYRVFAAGGHSGNPVMFSLPGPSAGVCSLHGDGFTVDLIGAGT